MLGCRLLVDGIGRRVPELARVYLSQGAMISVLIATSERRRVG